MTVTFFQWLDNRAREIDSLLCVGLDPHPELLAEQTPAAVRDFCFRIIDATHDLALAFKPNSAFFEAFGAEGFAVLKEVIAHVPAGIPVILDAKRGDIASTAEAYARAAFDYFGAHAITLNPYMGYDAIEPFIRNPERGAFVLARTSNPSASTFQDIKYDGKFFYRFVAETILDGSLHDENLGLVVGATDPDAIWDLRFSDIWLLIPGIGAQGGDLEAVLDSCLRPDGLGTLINASRSIAASDDPRTEAMRLRNAINTFRQKRRDERIASHVENFTRALVNAECVKFGQFTLKSGRTSPIYIDLRRLISYPSELRGVASALFHLLHDLEFDHLAGIPYAALPITTAVALKMKKSAIYPRREAKEYGTKAQIEGAYKPGDVAVLIDDLATTGGAKFEAIEKLESAGLVVRDVVVLIDREQGAREAIEARGYRFHAVATLTQLLNVWEAQGVISAEQRRTVDEYLASERGSQ